MREIDLEAERRFENEKALGGESRIHQSKFYWATALEINQHNQKVFRSIEGKSVLEIGCASGDDAIAYCKYAEKYTGLDISDEAIKNCKSHQLSNARFLCVDGHKIPADDKTFDVVIVNSLLHHLDLETSFSEISRVLQDEGKLLFREPLGTNPIFELYRRTTPSARTSDERPLTFNDLKLMNSYFEFDDIVWFGFSNIVSAFVRIPALRMILSNLDKMLSKTPLKYLYWQFAGIARKNKQFK